jgi:hypothetical protein
VTFTAPLYRQAMEIDNRTEATMQTATISDAAAPRYGYAPQVMFAATRAGAERRAREATTVATSDGARPAPSRHLLRRLAALLGA